MKALERIERRFNCREVLKKDEVAEFLGLEVSSLQKILQKRDTAFSQLFYKACGNWVCDIEDLAEFVEAKKHKSIDSAPLTINGHVRQQ